ncbi:MAG TPA: LamG domain-containing protein, partial [Chromatiales bacterium]|nr:LamG domain-containing protein [Chromatiales bacterium]
MNIEKRVGACLRSLLLAGGMLLGLSGCIDGVTTSQNPVTSNKEVPDYTGPAARTADVQAFKLSVWDNLKPKNRCGACHVEGGQAPAFVRQDDINLAYNEANGITNLFDPPNSRMVTKVAGGHNCWLDSDDACAAVITAYIEAWAGDSAGGGRTIELKAPPIKDAGASKSFPEASDQFAASVHPLLTAHCSSCHREN